MGDLDTDGDVEQSACQMRAGPCPRRAILHLNLVRFHVGDELRQVRGGNTGARCDDQRLLGHQRDRCKIRSRVIGRCFVQKLRLPVGQLAAEQNLIAVWIGPGDARGAGHAAGAGNIFDDDLVAENVGQRRGVYPPQCVVHAAWRERHHHRDRAVGPVLRAAGAGRRDGHRGNAKPTLPTHLTTPECPLAAAKQPLDVREFQFHISRAAVITLAGIRRRLHLAQQCIHLLRLEPPSGADRAVTGHR